MTKESRAEKAKRLESWADDVLVEDLVEAGTEELRHLAELADQRDRLEVELRSAVSAARKADRSWSEIGAMLGVSKQAAQGRFGKSVSST